MDVLHDLAFDPRAKASDRLRALKELLNRHSGTPPQSLDVTSGGNALPAIAVIELPAAPRG